MKSVLTGMRINGRFIIFMYSQQLGERKDVRLGELRLSLLPRFQASLEHLFYSSLCLPDFSDSSASAAVGQIVMAEMTEVEAETTVSTLLKPVRGPFHMDVAGARFVKTCKQ